MTFITHEHTLKACFSDFYVDYISSTSIALAVKVYRFANNFEQLSYIFI